jgi:DNA-binding MarR family transcriptional regulator
MSPTSRLLSRLERRGYVTSARDENDRRATNVRLTRLGEDVRVAVIKRRRQLMMEALAHHEGALPHDLTRGLHALGKAFAPYT